MIRKYQEADLESVLDVWYQASLVAHPFLSDAFLARERENIRDIYLKMADTWIYEKDEEVVGFISLNENEVGGIFVFPEWQGQGIGQALMDLARRFHRVLELEVYAENYNARRFYERYGFVGFKEYLYEETGYMMIRMRLEE